jgi:hypothetical protein
MISEGGNIGMIKGGNMTQGETDDDCGDSEDDKDD